MRQTFDDVWASSQATAEGFSYPADKPTKRIDYIFTRTADQIRSKRARVVETLASDHVPVVADLKIGKL
jgi:endonuclease/exonuclease/phosphatase family metal-dependent hydrolase